MEKLISYFFFMMNRIKVVVIGEGGSGKTELVRRILHQPASHRYVPTLGVDVHPCTVGMTVFDIWDTAGQERFSGLKEGYFIGAHAAILFQDVDRRKMLEWYRLFKQVAGDDAPVVVCGKGRPVTDFHREHNLKYINLEADHPMAPLAYLDFQLKQPYAG